MDQDISTKLENLQNFLREHMPTKAKMQQMRSELADKADVDRILTVADKIAKNSEDYRIEVTALSQRIEEMEGWIKQAAPKLGIEYKP
jgi:hypothetical protein